MGRLIRKIFVSSLLVWMLVSLACSLPVGGLSEGADPEAQTVNEPDVIAEASFEIRRDAINKLGSLEQDAAMVMIDRGTFDADTTVSIQFLAELPGDGAEAFTSLGPTVGLSVEGGQTRFNEPVTITLKFDPKVVNGPGDVYAAYYHEVYGWHYFVPDEVDMEEGVMHFTTYHFSWWSAVQPTDEEIIDKFVTKQSTEQFIWQTQQDLANQQVETLVRQIMEEGMGIQDNRTIEVISQGVVNEIPGGRIGAAINEKQPDAIFTETLAAVVDMLGKALKDGTVADISGEASTTEAFAEAADVYAQGDYQSAMAIMEKEILQNATLMHNAQKTCEAVMEVINPWFQDQWRQPEMEKAFEVYATGSDKYGYRSVDAGDFAGVMNQMGGLTQQVRIDYVASHCKQNGSDPAQLTDSETMAIADRGMDFLQLLWHAHADHQEEIKRIKENNMALMDMFKEKGLLEMVPGQNPMYTGHEDLVMLLNQLNQMTQKIMRDTGRSSFVTDRNSLDTDNPDSPLWGQDIADLVWIWYANHPDSEAAYQQALVDRGFLAGIAEEPSFADVQPTQFTLSGNSTFTSSFGCPDGTIFYEFNLWNVGALGGEQYAEVTYSILEPKYWVNDEEETCSYSGEVYEVAAVDTFSFSGGPNGVVTHVQRCWPEDSQRYPPGCHPVNEIFIKIVDGQHYLVYDWNDVAGALPDQNFTEYPVPDLSVFEDFD